MPPQEHKNPTAEHMQFVALPASNSKRRAVYDEIASADDREAWLAARRTGLGASEAATVMGVNPFESAYTLYMKKVGELADEPDEERMEWGKRSEPVVASKHADETGRRVFKGRLGGKLLRSREYPWLLATPDFEQRDDKRGRGLLETKTTAERYAENWQLDTPVYYQCQLQQQLLVSGLSYGSLACLIGGQQYKWKDHDVHDRFARSLVRKTYDFWRRVQQRDAPEPDDSPSTFDTLKRLQESGDAIELSPQMVRWFDELRRAAESRLAFQKEEEQYRRLLASAMGRASYGVFPDRKGLLKFTTVARREYTVPAMTYRELRYNQRIDVAKLKEHERVRGASVFEL